MQSEIEKFQNLSDQYPNAGLILEYNPHCTVKWWVIARLDWEDKYVCNADSLPLLISKLWKVLEKDWKEYKIHG